MANRSRKPPLASYTDPKGRRHRIVRRGRLVLDLCAHDLPRVVVELSGDEGDEQVEGVLHGSELDEGYLARMEREPAAICRALCAADVRRAAERSQAVEGPADRERGRAA